MPGGPNDYSGFTAVIPYGLGIRRNLGGGARARHFGSWSISLELSVRKTFSDYIDDVSTVYADPAALAEAKGPEAAILADRSTPLNLNGDPRGNADIKDSYHVFSVKFEYILGGKSGNGCNYNRNPPKTRSTKINQRGMFKK